MCSFVNMVVGEIITIFKQSLIISWRISFKKSKIKVKIPKHTKIVYSECLLFPVVLRVLCC